MQILDAKAAAHAIHELVNKAIHPASDDHHIAAFVTEVCGHLGLEPSHTNVAIVTKALHESDIQPHRKQDYPKMLVGPEMKDGKETGRIVPITDATGAHIIFGSAEEEKAWMAKRTA